MKDRDTTGADTDGRPWALARSSAADQPVYWLTLIGQGASHHHVTGTPLDACLYLGRAEAKALWVALGGAFGLDR